MSVRVLTPCGHGGVAVLSIGDAARERLATLLDRPLPAPGRVVLARVAVGGERLDEALVCATGEELELHVHGSPALVEELVALLAPAPARQPESGLEDRARRRLAEAPCEDAARILLDQAEGALRRALGRARLLAGEARRALLTKLVLRGERARAALLPPVVVLAGPAGAGKSTLFNAILGRERALVGESGGTTRDALRERALLGRWPVELVDTAGQRTVAGDAPAADLERAGQRLARSVVERADLVLWLDPLDGPGAGPPPARVPVVVLGSRADRASGPSGPRSIAARDDPARAVEVVREAVAAALDLPPAGAWEAGAAVPFEAAQREALANALARPERADALLAGLLGPGAR